MVGAYTTKAVTIGCDCNGYESKPDRDVRHYRFLVLVNGVANGEAVTALSATAGKHLATIGGLHAVTETVLVSFLSV